MNEEILRAQLAAVYASRSWRITAPMRLCMGFLLKLRDVIRAPRRSTGDALRRLSRHPRVRRLGPQISLHFPRLYQYLLSIAHAEPENPGIVQQLPMRTEPARMPDKVATADPAFDAMSAGARHILTQLQAARRQR